MDIAEGLEWLFFALASAAWAMNFVAVWRRLGSGSGSLDPHRSRWETRWDRLFSFERWHVDPGVGSHSEDECKANMYLSNFKRCQTTTDKLSLLLRPVGILLNWYLLSAFSLNFSPFWATGRGAFFFLVILYFLVIIQLVAYVVVRVPTSKGFSLPVMMNRKRSTPDSKSYKVFEFMILVFVDHLFNAECMVFFSAFSCSHRASAPATDLVASDVGASHESLSVLVYAVPALVGLGLLFVSSYDIWTIYRPLNMDISGVELRDHEDFSLITKQVMLFGSICTTFLAQSPMAKCGTQFCVVFVMGTLNFMCAPCRIPEIDVLRTNGYFFGLATLLCYFIGCLVPSLAFYSWLLSLVMCAGIVLATIGMMTTFDGKYILFLLRLEMRNMLTPD